MAEKKKLTTLNIVGIILIVFFLPIIVINLVFVIKGWINPDQVPMVFNKAPLIVASDSMTIEKDSDGNVISGAFNKNDLIFIKKVDPSTLEVGDIITYHDHEGTWTTHRITAIHEDGSFETKGDFSMGYDFYPVTYEQVQGIYTGTRLAGMGRVVHFFQTIPGILVLIGIPLVAILVLEFVQKQKESNKQSNENAALQAEIERLKAQQGQVEQPVSDSSEKEPEEKPQDDSPDDEPLEENQEVESEEEDQPKEEE